MLLKMAWRNVWRNKRRTLITTLALAFGVMAIVVIHSFREVATDEMFRSVTRGLVGHIQIHGRGYQASPEIDNLVRDPSAVESALSGLIPGAQSERRVLGGGLAGSGESSTAVMVMGIEPSNPAARSLLTIEKGRGLGDKAAREVVLGTSLARELKVEPGGELVLVGQAADGSLANDRFTVVGLADSGSSEANASSVFMHLADAQSFFALGEGVHQLIVRLPFESEDLTTETARLRRALGADALEVMAWTEILPELKSAVDAKRKNSRLIDLIVFLIVSLGILNTMTMSTFERTRELGVLASLGTRRRRILGMVVLEALLQGLIGFAIGLGLALAMLYGMGDVALGSAFGNAGGSDMLGARMPQVLALSVHLPSVAEAAIVTLLTMLAGALVPAIRASRLKPVEATRYV
jgi:ABC-type lipoprotein release transport system permease subunit